MYPLLSATDVNNINVINFLINYADTHNVILELNEQNCNDLYLLLSATINGNINILKLLIDYLNRHNLYIFFKKILYIINFIFCNIFLII